MEGPFHPQTLRLRTKNIRLVNQTGSNLIQTQEVCAFYLNK